MFSLSGLSIFHCLSVFSNVCSTNQQKNENTFLFDFAILLSLVEVAVRKGVDVNERERLSNITLGHKVKQGNSL
jgi:hypothetical protein